MSELLDCPFCGGSAVINRQYRSGGFKPMFWACCTACCVSMYHWKRDTEKEAKALWNKRAETKEPNGQP